MKHCGAGATEGYVTFRPFSGPLSELTDRPAGLFGGCRPQTPAGQQIKPQSSLIAHRNPMEHCRAGAIKTDFTFRPFRGLPPELADRPAGLFWGAGPDSRSSLRSVST